MTLFALAVSFLPYFETNNLAACSAAVPPPPGETIPAPERPVLLSYEKCPACGGAKHIMLAEKDFGQYGAGGRIGHLKTLKLDCPVCGGKGRIESYGDPDAVFSRIAADRSAFESAHKAKGDIAAGYAYLPADVWQGLDKKTLKAIAAAYGAPCRTCGWSGIEECRKCRGEGVAKCPNKNCKGGWSVEKRRAGRNDRISVTLCTECSGAGMVKCAECGGRRARPCRKCRGAGVDSKRRTSF